MSAARRRSEVSLPVLTSIDEVKAVLPLAFEDKKRLRSIALDLKRNRSELVALLALKIRDTLRPTRPVRTDAEMLAARILDSFGGRAASGELGSFVADLLEIGHDLAQFRASSGRHEETATQQVEPADQMILLYCFEQVITAWLIEAYREPDHLQPALAALSKLLHNSRLIIWSSQAAENRRLANELRDQARAVEAERRRREEFMSIVTHEFRGPLSVIIGYAQLVSKAIEKGAMVDPEMITHIWDQGHRLAGLVDVLADVSHIETGRFEISKSRTDVVAVVSRVVREFGGASERHRLFLVERVRPIVGNWDTDRLHQAFSALIDKLIKFSPTAGTIEVSVKRINSDARVSIRADKVELAAEDMPKLFQPFSEVFRQLAVRETGLDLYIAKGIIEAHGGTVLAEGIKGGGCRFDVLLPLK